MVSKFIVLTIITILLTSLIGCATFADYEARTTDEEEIKTAILNWWEAMDNRDAEEALSFIHEDARIMIGGRSVISKQQYSEMFPGPSEFSKGIPKMNVKGDEAIVKVPFRGIVSFMYIYNLVRENGRWYIMSTKY